MTQAALKLRGPWEVRRKFKKPALSDSGGAAHVVQALNPVTGVKGLAVDLDHHLVKVRYETIETDYTTISNALDAVGLPPKHGWWADRNHPAVTSRHLESADRNSVVAPAGSERLANGGPIDG